MFFLEQTSKPAAIKKEEVYSVLEAKVDKHGLEKLVIRCNKCTSQLHLTGFSLLQKLPWTDEETNFAQIGEKHHH